MHRPNILEFKQFRYARAAAALTALTVIAYFAGQPDSGAHGGTLLGYLFGTLAAVIVVGQIIYGLRKRITPKLTELRQSDRLSSPANNRRAYNPDRPRLHVGALQGWLSAHVYVGMAALVLATLHTGFKFGWNVHTLAYVLMITVALSGIYGTYAYLRFPRLMTANMGGADTLDTLLLKIEDLDKLASIKSLQFSDEICSIVHEARKETLIGGNVFQQLAPNRATCPTARAVRQLHAMGKGLKGDQLKSFNELHSVLVHKETLVTRARNEIAFKARLELWLYFHAPLALALATVLIAHIVSIFFYW